MSDFIAYNKKGEDYQRQKYEALGVLKSIFGCGTEDISEADTGSYSHWYEDYIGLEGF
jgi:hypothetical protein